VPLVVFITVAALNLLYQFWVHTRHIPKLGWFEWCFVTPSNHRAHHAQNALYMDRNYGGVFIIWDRLFGTFQEEDDNEPVIFGVTTPLASWNPLWANLQFYAQLWNDARRASVVGQAAHLVHAHRLAAGGCGGQIPAGKPDLSQFRKFEVLDSRQQCTCAVAVYVALGSYLMNGPHCPPAALILGWGAWRWVCSRGVALENRPWALSGAAAPGAECAAGVAGAAGGCGRPARGWAACCYSLLSGIGLYGCASGLLGWRLRAASFGLACSAFKLGLSAQTCLARRAFLKRRRSHRPRPSTSRAPSTHSSYFLMLPSMPSSTAPKW
jgi:hypothetical protein